MQPHPFEAGRRDRGPPARRWLAGLSLCIAPLPAHADDTFEVRLLASPGRTQLAEIADLDGDGRSDVLSVSFAGLPPSERREVRVHFQREDGSLPGRPDWIGALPEGAVAYDLAEPPGARGSECLFLVRDRIAVLSFVGRTPRIREIPIPAPPTIAIAPDERGLERLPLAHSELGPELRLLAPGLGEAFLFATSGETLARMEVGARANYFAPPRPGLLVDESEIKLYYDVPRLQFGDVDGDGRADLVASQRHEVRVFLQREGGGFPVRADRILALGLMSESDHVSNAGSVRVDARDVDGDGLVDLLVARSSEGIFRARTETRFHLNRGGGWDLGSPDQVFLAKGGFSMAQLVDLDSDGRPEFVDVRVPLSVLELVEVLLTRAIDSEIRIYRSDRDGGGKVFEETPWLKRKLGIPFSFETFRPLGFVPTIDRDLNGDGYPDLLTSLGGEGLEIRLGGPKRRYRKRVARQELDSGGRIRFGDFDGDGLLDFLLHDSRRPNSPLRLAINRGSLPGVRREPSLVTPPGS